ncbi:hypothetical protein AQUCO_01700113v1 [Aquilegia coerulea]|uniref:Uncharacterized protein n=1 Tax=Aquilegia coerulea TaxID=218851 RepID=A0A2G5DL95_AQUCA|nr:hypothetical protein AQUCO_01700113v1 [Aquilegia coerulea]
MEGFSANVYKGIKGYWKRKHYQRIHRSGSPCRKSRVELTDLSTNRRKRFWRIKITPKLKIFNISSTKKFFIRLRDWYVDLMLGVASSKGLSAGLGGGGGSGGSVGYGFGKGPVKEYDEKVLVDIYKSLMLQGKLVPYGTTTSAPAVLYLLKKTPFSNGQMA